MRLLGLDYGSKTVGVAVTDPLGYTAQPLETITRKEENKLRRTLARIEQLVGEYQIEKIVLGYPVNMDGSAGERAELALAFKAMLERRTKLEVIMQDERLTTVAADEILQECGMPREKRKTVIDQVAAGWKTRRMGKVELAVLRLGAYELRYDDDIPNGVAINEAIEIAKKYGQESSGGFVNAILAKIMKSGE